MNSHRDALRRGSCAGQRARHSQTLLLVRHAERLEVQEPGRHSQALERFPMPFIRENNSAQHNSLSSRSYPMMVYHLSREPTKIAISCKILQRRYSRTSRFFSAGEYRAYNSA